MHAADGIAYHYANNNSLNTSDIEIVKEQDALYDVPVGIVVVLSLFYGTISILAVIGNLLVIWIVLTTKYMQNVTNMFIANLALADVTIGMFAIPFQFQAAVLQRWNLPEFMCPFCPFVQLLSVNVSVFTLTAIAVDRHKAIINPLRARKSKNVPKFVLSAIWVTSFALAAPTIFALRVVPVSIVSLGSTNETYTNMTKPFCQVVNFEESEMLLYRYILTLVQYFIPLCVISFVYIQMAFRLWGSRMPGNAQDVRDNTVLRNKKRVIKMLIIVVALFAICWFPLQLYNVLHVTWPSVNEYRYINIIWFVCDWLAMSNSCYNPFIYGIYNEKFKREFRNRFTFRGKTLNHDQATDRTISMCTRVSSIRSSYATSSIRNMLHTTKPMTSTFNKGGGGGGCRRNHTQNYNSQQQQQFYRSTVPQNSVRFTNSTIDCRRSNNPLREPKANSRQQSRGSSPGSSNNDELMQNLLLKTEEACGGMKPEQVSLNHPHPDSSDEDGERELVSHHLSSANIIDSNGKQKRISSSSSSASRVNNGRSSDRLHLYSNNLQSVKLYD
ncbi:neuropeptide Y receptor type 1 [Toxorhynchites rutilus septentrionalis]|uniref:neuropeptide Y receptor type 1 n=1 Tax=Toxorhynchites rutilus septentrionalis TaxID=329112 RepID=UPI00247A25B5|nr:neuropeptide Y receptor type 1 [Toxorhynchites rutilus septentrionalis]XP_055627555.1 neuropeptide Y receptor type 1 [Toxorhynchites rutilus septentrionalis]